jgi:type I restriction enzyme R subunit
MNKYRVQEEENGRILLTPTDATLENQQGDGHKSKQPDSKEILKVIVKEINDKYAIDLGDDNKVADDIYESLKRDTPLMASLRADNIEDAKKMKLRESIDEALLKSADLPLEFMNRLSEDKSLADLVVSRFFDLLMKEINEAPTGA